MAGWAVYKLSTHRSTGDGVMAVPDAGCLMPFHQEQPCLPHQYCNLWIACMLACTQPKTAMHPQVMHIPQVHGFPELQVSISPNKVTCCHALGKAGYCCYRLQHQRRPVWAVSGAGHGQLEHSQHCLASSGCAHPTASWHHTAPGNTLDLG